MEDKMIKPKLLDRMRHVLSPFQNFGDMDQGNAGILNIVQKMSDCRGSLWEGMADPDGAPVFLGMSF